MDPNVRFAPKSLKNWAGRKAFARMLKKMEEAPHKFKGSVWDKRLTEGRNVAHYSWLKGQIEDFLKKKAEQNPNS